MKQLGVLILFAAILLAAAPGAYRVTGKIEIGKDGGWDYLTADADTHRLYVSHGNQVMVIDMDKEKVVGEIPDTPGVHGIAIAFKLNRGFISNGRGNNVTIFDLKTLQSLGQVASGQNPDAIFYDPASNLVYTFNGRSKDATVIDAAAGKVVATIPLGGKPEAPATDGKGKLWVNIEDTHEIAEINIAAHTVTKRYSLNGCEEPSGLAIDVNQGRLFSVCANKVMVVSDPAAGKVVASVPIGAGSDGAGFDAARGLAFSSNGGDGTLTVVRRQGGKYEVAETVPTQRGARTISVDQKSHKIYLPTADFEAAAAKQGARPAAVPGSFKVLVVSQ
jgi:YVTN family beta-propeller protein